MQRSAWCASARHPTRAAAHSGGCSVVVVSASASALQLPGSSRRRVHGRFGLCAMQWSCCCWMHKSGICCARYPAPRVCILHRGSSLPRRASDALPAFVWALYRRVVRLRWPIAAGLGGLQCPYCLLLWFRRRLYGRRCWYIRVVAVGRPLLLFVHCAAPLRRDGPPPCHSLPIRVECAMSHMWVIH